MDPDSGQDAYIDPEVRAIVNSLVTAVSTLSQRNIAAFNMFSLVGQAPAKRAFTFWETTHLPCLKISKNGYASMTINWVV